MTPGATQQLAEDVLRVAGSTLPPAVRHEALRCFGHFVGCALSGCSHDVSRAIQQALLPLSGAPRATLIGRGVGTDVLLAALANGASASAHSYDDTHARAIVHPGAPVCAAALAVAQAERRSGGELLTAVALGVEVTCRASASLSVAPAQGNLAWYQTGICGGIGAAVAAGLLLQLDAVAMRNAIGIAAAQACGQRVLQGSMAMLMLAGHAAQSGVKAALLARAKLESPADTLEGPRGWLEVFSPAPHAAFLTEGFGTRFELLDNTYKAYPCGVVLHPVVDACLALRSTGSWTPAALHEIRVHLSPVALTLTDRAHPSTRTSAQVSVQHWSAVALALGRAGLPEGEMDVVGDPSIAGMRDRVRTVAEPEWARDEASVELLLEDGSTLSSARYRGVAPMDDAALEHKFRAQAALVHRPARVDALVRAIAGLPRARDLAELAAVL